MQRLFFPLLGILAVCVAFGLRFGATPPVGTTSASEPRPESATAVVNLPLVLGAGPRLTFAEGVASGDVTDTAVTLWTRGSSEAAVVLEVATDAGFTLPAQTTTITFTAASDFTSPTRVTGLAPGQIYYYRWRRGRQTSPTGKFKTAPVRSQAANVRFAFSGDTDGTLVGGQPAFNQFEALDAVRAGEPDFFVYLGDTVYTDSFLRPSGPAQTLADYRAVYRTNRSYPALTNLFAAVSTYAIWDDHEIQNDFAGQTVSPARYTTGRQAFLEYMPIDGTEAPAGAECAGAPLFRAFHWGQDVDVIILDERSCRSADVGASCVDESGIEDLAPTLPSAARLLLGLPAIPPLGCRDAIAAPNRTMLGAAQKAAFKDALQNSSARFKFIINQVPIQQYYLGPYDRWEGYAAERQEILNFIRSQQISNVIFLSGDAHMNLMNDVYIDKFTDPAPIAYEVITGPVAALTMEEALTRFIGPDAVTQMHAALSLIGVDCRDLDAYSYGVVDVEAGKATITLRDDTGQAINDQLSPSISCVRVFGN